MGTHDSLLAEYPNGVYDTFVQKQEQAGERTQARAQEEDEDLEKEMENAQPELGKPISKKKTISKVMYNDGKAQDVTVEVEMDDDEYEKLEECKKADKKEEEEYKKFLEDIEENGGFKRLLPFNKPIILVVFGLIGSALAGST